MFVDYETTVRDPAWYNYSLAHEVGHLVLHPQVFEAATHKTRAEFDAFRRKIGQDTYSKLEQQAHLFAGALIAPAQLLERTADEVIATVRSHGIELTPMLDVDWPIIFREIGRRLNVNDRTLPIAWKTLGSTASTSDSTCASATTCAGASGRIHRHTIPDARLKSILAILMLALACARPVPARTDAVESQGGTGALSRAL
ncbi:MAG: ImmA/IrrE family metallo-endopeptidase [bacterium]|nr:ImmA/IrrE family metallo-endopeptidase [bacterium]